MAKGLPHLMPKHPRDMRLPEPKFLRNFTLTNTASRVSLADIVCYLLRHAGVAEHRAPRLSAFGNHVGVIVALRAQEKVRGVAARRVIATVEYAKPTGNRAIVQPVGKAVGVSLPATLPCGEAVILTVPAPCPNPAGIGTTRPVKTVIQGLARVSQPIVALDEPGGLALYKPLPQIASTLNWRGLTAAALAKFGGIKAKLDRFCYTVHCQILSLGFGRAEGRLLRRFGFSVPNYSTPVREMRGMC